MPTPDLVEFLRTTPLFGDVDPSVLAGLAKEMTEASLATGATLIRTGDVDTNLYLVRQGRLRLIGGGAANESRALFDVHSGESIAEMAVISSEPSPVDVQAVEDTRLVALPRVAFDRFSEAHSNAALSITQKMSERMQRYRLSVALHVSGLFDNLSPEVLRDLESELELFTLYGGEVLFRQGDPGDYLCIIISGRVRIISQPGASQPGASQDGRKGETVVTELGSGELVGEMAVVGTQVRSATVEAARDSQLARLTKAAYERFVVKHPMAAVRMVACQLAGRLRDTTSGGSWKARRVATIAVLPVHPDTPHSDFCDGLIRALSKFGSALRLTSRGVDEHLGRDGIAQTFERSGGNIRLVEWLNRQELEYSYLVYEGDAVPTPWTERCIRQADHVILVAESSADPAPGDMENELLRGFGRQAARASLVLIHRDGDPSRTVHWLDARSVVRHFHARRGDDQAIERVARTITSRAVGLTLGGGFARGLAHIGVFRACEEMGIAVDAVGGASMGAIVGAFWAMGWDRETIQQKLTAICTDIYGDLTFPFIAFKTGKKFSDSVRELIGDLQIEDLWMPYFCVSANLNRSELKIHTRGSLAKAVLAASRAPGVFPPVVFDGELHVDGGVINNVPVDLMKEFSNSGITVGVDVSPPHELHPISDYGDTVSGWRAFWRRRNAPLGHFAYIPSILLVMIRTLEYSGISNKNFRLKSADIYMYPDMLKFRRTDFHRAAEIVQTGFDCARAELARWMADPDSTFVRRPDLGAAQPHSTADAGTPDLSLH